MYEASVHVKRNMSEGITVLCWNVQGEIGISDTRMDRQLEFLEAYATDVDFFLFQAVNYDLAEGERWEGQLGVLCGYLEEAGYHVVHTGDWAHELMESSVQPHTDIEGTHNRCNLIASRWPIERRPLTLRNEGRGKPEKLNYYYSQFPEKLLIADVDTSASPAVGPETLKLWNVGIINGSNWHEEKLNMLETVYGRIYVQTERTATPVLLGGDFNAPKREKGDGSIVPHGQNVPQYTNLPDHGNPYHFRDSDDNVTEFEFNQRWQRAEARIFDSAVGDWEMRDVYWAASDSPRESSEDDYTHELPNGTPDRKRLDHVLVSQQFDVETCQLWNGEAESVDAFEASDHAPVMAKLHID